MTVYLDLVMGLNFIVDLLLLTGTNRLAGYVSGYGRATAAAALGGLYSGACFLPGFQFLGNLLWRLVSLVLMSLTAFGFGTGTVRRTVLFVLLSMALGGIVLAFGTGGTWTVIAGAMGVLVLCTATSGAVNGKELVPVRLMWDGRTVELTALRDTGNTLRDPLTGEGILIAGPRAAKELLGLEQSHLEDPSGTMVTWRMPGLRLVPYRAVGQEQGLLLGVRIKARIRGKQGSVTVAFAPSGLGTNGEEYDALIGGTA